MSEDDISPDQTLALQAATAAPDQKMVVESNRVFLAGTRDYPDFEESVERLKSAEVTHPDFLAQVLELDNPAKVLHELGQEEAVETAKKLAKMTPVRRAAALAAYERGEPIAEKASVPMWKRSKADLGNENLSEKEWSALYDKKYGRGGMPRKY
jgi:hypothetical protein